MPYFLGDIMNNQNKVKELFDRINSISPLDHPELLAFIEEMKTAKTIAFYNDEKKQKYADLDIFEFKRMYVPDRNSLSRHNITFASMKSRLISARRHVSSGGSNSFI